MVPHTTTAKGELLAQEYIQRILPKPFRDVYWPNLKRSADLLRTIRPSDIARRDWELEMLKSIERAGEILRGDNTEERMIWTL